MAIALIAQGRFNEPPLSMFPNFPRNLAPSFTHYLRQGPEMSSP